MGRCQVLNPAQLIRQLSLTLFNVLILLRNPLKGYSNKAYTHTLALLHLTCYLNLTYITCMTYIISPHSWQQALSSTCSSSNNQIMFIKFIIHVLISSHSTMHVHTLLDHHSTHARMHDYINACSYLYSKTFKNPNYSTKQIGSK